MEPEGILPHSQAPAIYPYPEPDQSSPCPHIPLPEDIFYVGYSESKYRLRISLAHPRDCHFAHVQKPQMPFCEICFIFMFVPVC